MSHQDYGLVNVAPESVARGLVAAYHLKTFQFCHVPVQGAGRDNCCSGGGDQLLKEPEWGTHGSRPHALET